MWLRSLLLFAVILLIQSSAIAGGISTDAGLTPAQSRWIIRSQYRIMGMESSMMTMNTTMVPLVLAYGVTPGFSVMARGMYLRRSNSASGEISNGMNDLYLLTKFRLYRKNTSSYAFGIAPHLASNIPVGSVSISGRTWNPEVGLNISYRPRFLSFDLSTSYTFTDIMEKVSGDHANVYALNFAISGNIPIQYNSSRALSPVVEFNYINTTRQSIESGYTSTFFLSPGIAYIHSSVVLEALYQVPVSQSASADFPLQKKRFILGFRIMF